MRKTICFLFLIVTIFVPLVFAGAAVVVQDPWVRWLPGGRPNSAAFMVIKNESSAEIVLKSVTSTKIRAIEMHTMANDNGMMQMRKVSEIVIPANGQVELKSGGLHLMVFGLPESFKAGDEVDLTLKFSDGTETVVHAVAKLP